MFMSLLRLMILTGTWLVSVEALCGQFPSCGVASVYALLREKGLNVGVRSAETQFQRICHSAEQNGHSVYQLSQVVSAYGLKANH